jgi:F-type H+-transporting ATPase subunit b
MLEINPGLILWTIITFVIVLLILRATAWKPLLAVLTAREEQIRSSLEEARETQQKAQQLLEDHRKQLALAEEQSQRIIKEGRDMAERLKAEILEKAQRSATFIVTQAKDEIRREKETALMQLRSEVADLAILAAGKLLDANLDTPRQRALADEAIKDINKG